MLQELRQGALEGVMVEAVARAAGVPPDLLRHAHMLRGSLRAVAVAALTGGEAALRRVSLQVFRPLQPMLAQPAEELQQVLKTGALVGVEAKLDGVRVQVHKDNERVEVYTRKLHQVTAQVPELVELVRDLPARRLVLDGETLALHPDGSPRPFQETMSRFGSKLDVAAARKETPLSVAFFDALLVDD